MNNQQFFDQQKAKNFLQTNYRNKNDNFRLYANIASTTNDRFAKQSKVVAPPAMDWL